MSSTQPRKKAKGAVSTQKKAKAEKSQDNKPVNQKVNVTLGKFQPVYTVVVDDCNPDCSVCRQKLANRCPDCVNSGNPPEKCRVVRGKCGHRFHDHCIRKCLEESPACPDVCCNCQHWEIDTD